MKIKIICPGKIKEKWLKDGIDEYKKRLSRFSTLEIIEVNDSPDDIPVNIALQKEAELILDKIKPSEVVWVMDLHGKLVTSEDISQYLINDIERGGSNLTIIIGGSNGLDKSLTSRADRRICLGNITLTHQMTRLIIVEQLYRGFKIANNEKYHK
ncbi:MAG: 23S rRNA (pseudouridine(1915)-N(3))-methyltransferase RlmH [Clostridia bacterium]|nr:23S rRNA (pseudouridine(1915)-N(3))-methyltransferase RlmH [Clostridia bacterium]